MTFRYFRIVSRTKRQTSLVEEMLQEEGYEFKSLNFYPQARKLLKEPQPLGSSLAAFFSYIYVQDKSSMLPPLFLNPQKNDLVLDLCASPGGKSGLLAELMQETGLVLANEPNKKRFQSLVQIISEQGLTNLVFSNFKGEEFPLTSSDVGLFDRILLDVPCSAWGTVDKHPRIKDIWTQAGLKPLVQLQKKLLTSAENLIAPGGTLVYSTCTTNPEENQDQIDWALEKLDLEPAPELIPSAFFKDDFWLEQTGGKLGWQVQGDKSKSQSFFISALKKPGQTIKKKKKNDLLKTKGTEPLDKSKLLDSIPGSLSPEDIEKKLDGRFIVKDEKLIILPNALENLPQSFTNRLSYIFLGSRKDSRFVLNSRSRLLLTKTPPQESLVLEKTEQLRQLLSGQSLKIKSQSKQLPLYYKELPLGLVAVKGGRALWVEK